MDWEVYLSPTGDSASLFLSHIREKYNHQPVEKNGQFLGGVHLRKYEHLHGDIHDIDVSDDRHMTQLSLVENALEDTDYASMCHNMLDYFSATLMLNDGISYFENGLGCVCGISGNPVYKDYGGATDVSVMANINSAIGCAEGIIHELGHYKLHAAGIHMESWDPSIIGNNHDSLYPSPVLIGTDRPMGAVMQAQFSYVYVTDFYTRILKIMGSDSEYLGVKSSEIWERQAYNIKRIGNGIHTIRESFHPGDSGFYEAFMSLCLAVYKEAIKYIPTGDPGMDWMPEKGHP